MKIDIEKLFDDEEVKKIPIIYVATIVSIIEKQINDILKEDDNV